MKKIVYILVIVLFIGGIFGFSKVLRDSSSSEILPDNQQAVTPIETTSSEFNTYRNNEFGFEFEYPKNWTVEENSFGSPSSKFNLRIFPSSGNYIWIDPIGLNITGPAFADATYSDLEKKPGVVFSDITVAGRYAKKYEFEDQSLDHINVYIPIKEQRFLLGTIKQYEKEFSLVLSSFKFLK